MGGQRAQSLQKAGLLEHEDESIRLYRTPAFQQYVEVIEDFSQRIVTNAWKTLQAFKGLEATFEDACTPLKLEFSLWNP